MRPDFASRLAIGWLADAEPVPWRELHGTAVLADLSGFTGLTEALAVRGAEGAEVLHRALTVCFASLLEPSVRAGGDIIGFAGDAALVWFDGDDHHERALSSALAMPARLAQLPAAVTGGKRLRVSVGAHTGTMTAVLAGSDQRMMVLCGPAMRTLVGLESAAAPGQVLVSRALADRLTTGWRTEASGPGFVARRRRAAPTPPPPPAPATTIAAVDDRGGAVERAATLLSPAVRALMNDDVAIADHRAVSVGFLAVPGLDELLATGGPAALHAALEHVADVVSHITRELGVSWLDVDSGAGAVKFLLASGAPHAVDDDEGRLLVALRRILDTSEVPLRAGAQRGRLFAGSLGVPGRRGFTLLGDAANVAARALGLAGERELVVADGLGVATRPTVHAVALGAIELKNRREPVAMWRVAEVHVRHGGPAAVAVAAGRGEERDRIVGAWKRTVDGGPGREIVVVGEPGMGGTELLAEVADLAGGAASVVAPDTYRQQLPYGTIATVVEHLWATAGAPTGPSAGGSTSSDAVAWLLSFVAAIPAEMIGWLDDADAALRQQVRADDIDPTSTVRRSRLALAALIEAAAPTPWILVVDGIDSVDDASRAIIQQLGARAGERRWLVLVATAARPDAAAAASGGTQDLVVLSPLDDAAATHLVLEIQPRLRADQVGRIVAAGKGNPFVLRELARHPDDPHLPDTLERAAVAQLDALPTGMRGLVRDASTFGSTIPLTLAAMVLGRPELAEPDSWEAARAVLRPGPPGTVVFRHDALREAAHRALLFERRRRLHSAIADALAGTPDGDPAVLARHLEEAGRTREAFPLAAAAGRAALAAGALVEAHDLLARAARMARIVDRPARGGLLMDQGDALLRLGDLPAAERAFAAAARALDDPLDHGRLCSHRADVALRGARWRSARTWVRKGLTLTAPLGDAAAAVRVALLVADVTALLPLAKVAEARRVADDALAAALVTGDRYLEGRAHQHLEMVCSTVAPLEARRHAEAAIAAFEAVGHDHSLGVALVNHAITLMHGGDWDGSLALYSRAAGVLARTGDAVAVAIAELNPGFLLLRQGRPAEADALAVRALQVLDAAGSVGLAGYARQLRGRVAAAEGRFADATELMALAREAFVAVDDEMMAVDCDIAALEQLLWEGRADDAATLVIMLRARVRAKAETTEVVMFGLLAGLAAARTGRMTVAVTEVGDALAAACDHGLPYQELRCLDALLEIERAGGPPAPAESGARRAVLARRLGLVEPGDAGPGDA